MNHTHPPGAPPGDPKPPNPTGPGRALLSVAELADRWGCSRDHIYTLIASGALPVVDIGTGRPKTRIRLTTVEQFEQRNERRAPRRAAA